jgi:two-component system cell cycle sensor histidine kinase/response regulator CckA
MLSEILEWLWIGTPDVPRTILVVEDDPTQRPILSRILYKVNPTMDLLWAENTQEAKAILCERPVDLLITDILLEGEETGVDLYHACVNANASFPVLFITGYSQDSLKKRGISLSKSKVDESAILLPKPISPTKVQESINELMKKKAWEKIADSYTNNFLF